MKKATVMPPAALLELPQISKIPSVPFSYRKTSKQVEGLPNGYLRPTEELICHLNSIGREYPFCAYYKEKANDPL
jgi:hypothetical protein